MAQRWKKSIYRTHGGRRRNSWKYLRFGLLISFLFELVENSRASITPESQAAPGVQFFIYHIGISYSTEPKGDLTLQGWEEALSHCRSRRSLQFSLLKLCINWSRCSFCKERLERMSSLSKEWRGDSFFMKRDSLFTMLFPFLCPKQKSKSLFIALCKRLHCPCRPLKEWWERIALSLFTKRVT